MAALKTKSTTLKLAAAALVMVFGCSRCSCERADGRCGSYRDGKCEMCSIFRCCDDFGDCGYFFFGYCCPFSSCKTCPSAASTNTNTIGTGTSISGTSTNTSGTGSVYGYATHNGDLDHSGGDHYHDLPHASSFLSSSACTTALSLLPPASIHKYPRAAYVPRDNFTNTVTYCGRCLKVTNVGDQGGRGVHREVIKVVIVEEFSNSRGIGIELDIDGFRRLDVDGRGPSTGGQLTVKYEFESC